MSNIHKQIPITEAKFRRLNKLALSHVYPEIWSGFFDSVKEGDDLLSPEFHCCASIRKFNDKDGRYYLTAVVESTILDLSRNGIAIQTQYNQAYRRFHVAVYSAQLLMVVDSTLFDSIGKPIFILDESIHATESESDRLKRKYLNL